MTPGQVEELKVPEGLTEDATITVLEWHVHEREAFLTGQALVDLVIPDRVETLVGLAPGRITEILVDEGAVVDPGELLALFVGQQS